MRRRCLTWLESSRLAHPALLLGVALILLVLTGIWVSVATLELERSEREAHATATNLQQLALGRDRIELVLNATMAAENARPATDYFALRPETPTGASSSPAPSLVQQPQRYAVSPLLGQQPQHTLLYVELHGDGRVTSPQVPAGRERAMALKRYLGAAELARAERRLKALSGWLNQNEFRKQMGPARLPDPAQQRRFSTTTANSNVVILKQTAPTTESLKALWLDDELVLARWARHKGVLRIQMVWLNWSSLKQWLEQTLTNSSLPVHVTAQPKNHSTDHAKSFTPQLARWPLALATPTQKAPASAAPSSLTPMLLGTWVSLLLAALAMVVVVTRAMTLSGRRAAFVSAVTHELRTPLTTLQTYAEMLADDKITDPQKRNRYLRTIQQQAVRLAHLIDNVLAYSRIEVGKKAPRRQQVQLAVLLTRISSELEERAERAHLTLCVELPSRPSVVLGNESAIERIVYNLVDNACKYAAGTAGQSKRLIIATRRSPSHLQLTVQDDGPGIHAKSRGKLFHAFHKSAEDAAGGVAGVGLGLALCKRLAQDMGGDLLLDEDNGDGACFMLQLRLTAVS